MTEADDQPLATYEILEYGGCGGTFRVTARFDLNAGGDGYDLLGIQVVCEECPPSFGGVAWSADDLWRAVTEHARRHLPAAGGGIGQR